MMAHPATVWAGSSGKFSAAGSKFVLLPPLHLLPLTLLTCCPPPLPRLVPQLPAFASAHTRVIQLPTAGQADSPYHKPSSSYPFRRDIMRHGPHSTDTTYPTAIASSSRSSSPPPPCTSPPRDPVCPSSLCSTGPRSHWPSHRNPLVVRVHRQRRPEGGIPACPLAPRRYYPTRLHLLSPPQRLPPRPLTPNGASLRVPARRATSPPPVRFPLPLPAQEEGQDP